VQGPAAVEKAHSGFWPDGIKGDLNQALVLLGLVLLMLVVFINCCLGFFVLSLGCSCIWFCYYQPSDWLERLAGRIVSKMTYNVLSGT